MMEKEENTIKMIKKAKTLAGVHTHTHKYFKEKWEKSKKECIYLNNGNNFKSPPEYNFDEEAKSQKNMEERGDEIMEQKEKKEKLWKRIQTSFKEMKQEE